MTLLWRSNLGTELIQDNQHLFPNTRVIIEGDKEKALNYLDEIDILVDGNPPVELLNGQRLKHVIVPFVGIEPSLREALLERPHIKLHNSHYNAGFVAQHAFALLLACTNRIVEADRTFRKGDWRERNIESVYLEGKTCLLVGYGAIGQKLIGMLQSLGMNVSVLKRTKSEKETTNILVYTTAQLQEALATADVIICSLPETPETFNLLDKAAFTAMKPNSILVNVGRGKVTNQHALYDALKSRHLLAAGIDVWWNYPKNKEAKAATFPSDAPLHELPNIVMSPHRANQAMGENLVRLEDVAKTVQAIARGEERSIVNVERGY